MPVRDEEALELRTGGEIESGEVVMFRGDVEVLGKLEGWLVTVEMRSLMARGTMVEENEPEGAEKRDGSYSGATMKESPN